MVCLLSDIKLIANFKDFNHRMKLCSIKSTSLKTNPKAALIGFETT